MYREGHVVIGSRGSKLALWQAYYTRDKLEAAGYSVEIRIIKTKGDRIQHLSFDKIEGKGFFTKELEDALLEGEVDLAVHSCKDVPSESPEGLAITAYSSRANPVDVLLIHPEAQHKKYPLSLKKGAVVGTSSARRKAQLLAFRPDISLKDIRGNVPTRVQKLRDGQFDAIMLAGAGLDRLELDTSDLIRIDLPPTMFIPAPAQGILAYQIRDNDDYMRDVTALLNDPHGSAVAGVERGLLNAFEGGCQVPLGIYAEHSDERTDVWISRASAWNAIPVRVRVSASEPLKSTQEWIRQIKNLKPGSVFISKDLEEDNYFRTALEGIGFSVSGQSLIGFEPVRFELNGEEDFDWVFFVSKNGVKYFFGEGGKLPANARVAAVNVGTAAVLRQFDVEPDFIGKGGSLTDIAQTFDALNGDKVLFVRAETSNRTVQHALNNKIVQDLIVYRNFVLNDAPGSGADVLVFTSPMNVESYFTSYSLLEDQSIVAIGPTTEKALASRGYTCRTAIEPTMWALVDEVVSAVLD